MHVSAPPTMSTSTAKVKLNRTVVACTITAALGGLLFGFDTAVIAGITNALVTKVSPTTGSEDFTVAIALGGTIVGAALGGNAGDRWGRRDSLRWLAGLFIVSSLG